MMGTGMKDCERGESRMPAEILDRVLDGRIAWTRDSLSSSDGVVALTPDCLAEIREVAALLKDNPVPVLALNPDEFDMPSCKRSMAEARRELDQGVGFVLVDRLPVDEFGRETATAIYWLLCSMVARPVAQKWDGCMVYDVRDTGQKPGNGVRPDITNVEQNFHTDNSYNLCPPDYVALLCLQTAKLGGISRIVSFASAHNEMRRRHPELLPRLYRPYWFDRQREHAPDDVKVLSHPLFEAEGGRLLARLSRFQVVNGYKLAMEALDDEGAAALDALEAIMNQPGLGKEFFFERGQIQILDNRRCGHKRTEFHDHPEPERKRHLVRLWLRERGRIFYNG
jgi:alpha-ketoglutarate-dependent taurine dioxygenase